MKLTKLTQHAGVAVAAVVILSGAAGLIGSNMGFKAVRNYNYNSAPAAANRFGIALPHNSPWSNSTEFLTHLCTTQPSPVDLTLVKYDNSVPASVTHTISSSCGSFIGAEFTLVAGEGYQIELPAGSPGLTGVVLVGSQNPSWTGGTLVYNSAPAAANRFGIALTPNTKWATSADVLTAFCAEGPFDLTLVKYDNSVPGSVIHAITSSCGSFAGTEFALVPFESYQIELPAGSPNVSWPAVPYY